MKKLGFSLIFFERERGRGLKIACGKEKRRFALELSFWNLFFKQVGRNVLRDVIAKIRYGLSYERRWYSGLTPCEKAIFLAGRLYV